MRTWAAMLIGVLILGVVGCSTTPVLRDPRLVESVTTPPRQPAPQSPPPLLGRWYGAGWSTLDIYIQRSGDSFRWIWNSSGTRWEDHVHAVGTGSVAGDEVSLVGRLTDGSTACGGGEPRYTFTLKWDGRALRGTMTWPCSTVPVAVEFKRGPQVRPL